MKRKLQHPTETNPTSASRAWRSPGQLNDTPEFREWLNREFPAGAAEMASEDEADLSRRGFLKFMGASTALAGFGLASCRKPESYLVPYVDSVEWVVPGRPLLYATSRPRGNGAVPMVVTTHEGRPTKLEGNPLHPHSTGATDGQDQASILDMYDPDRSAHVLMNGKQVDARKRNEAMVKLTDALRSSSGSGVGLLVGRSSSPTRDKAINALKAKYSGLQVFEYEALAPVNAYAAADKVFGKGVRPVVNFRNAKRVLSLDADFLGNDLQDASASADFAAARKPEDGDDNNAKTRQDTLRLYVTEPSYTITGGMADHRLRVTGSRMAAFAALLAKELGVSVPSVDVDEKEFDPRWVKAAAADLRENGAKSIVLVGSRQPQVVHEIAFAINAALGSIGSDSSSALQLVQTDGIETGTLADLKAAVDSGSVKTLLSTTPANPAYDTAGDFDWEALRGKLDLFVHSDTRVNATAITADYHLPSTHFLETWGDVRDSRGVYSVVQPMILPLYETAVSELNVLLALASDSSEGEGDPAVAAVRETVGELTSTSGNELDNAWSVLLRDGYLKDSSYPAGSTSGAVSIDGGALKKALLAVPAKDALEVNFAADYSISDGRVINNGWLQESPDPITKLTWDNAALISPDTAEAIGLNEKFDEAVQEAPMIELSANGRSITIPVLVAYGHADNSITLPLGYGQGKTDADGNPVLPMRVGQDAGVDVNPLRNGDGFVLSGVTAKVTDGKYILALTQEHSTMEGRAIVREGTLDEQKNFDPDEDHSNSVGFAYNHGMDSHIPENMSLYKPKDASGNALINDPLHQWGMVIDLNSCTGCNACQVACQAENNIPIVGKDQVRRGREMHWIRMDRYFVAKQTDHGEMQDMDNPEMLVQPVACVHCESAPCETVCPVNATVHNEEGLNLMAYNRCIGTRYCANNCPYKARRFNFFDYNKRPLDELYKGPFSSEEKTGMPESKQLAKNPNVTVRMRGVIEKCTYCIQRIQVAKIKKTSVRRDKVTETGKPSEEISISNEELRVDSKKLKTACQQACPSEAIVFGNMLDPKSRIHKFKQMKDDQPAGEIVLKHPRSYDLLRYIGTRPRTNYLARVRNPNKKMPDAKYVGNATVTIH